MTSPADLPTGPELPAPLTLERIQAYTASREWTVTPGEKSVRGRWGNADVEVSLNVGKLTVFQFRGVWVDRVPLAREADVATFANDWHRDRIWPTLHWRVAEDHLVVVGVVGWNLSAGVTDTQLAESFKVGIATITQSFHQLRAALDR